MSPDISIVTDSTAGERAMVVGMVDGMVVGILTGINAILDIDFLLYIPGMLIVFPLHIQDIPDEMVVLAC